MAYIGSKPINVANGGTGAVTLTNHGVLIGAATGTINAVAVGANGTLLRGNTGADPTFSTSSSGSFSFSRSSVGSGVSLSVANLDNTNAASHAIISSTTGGGSAGDPMQQFIITGATTWTHGCDNSVTSPENDPFVISSSTSLGTNNVFSATGTGLISFPTQSCFLAFLPSTVTNVTGNGGVYTLGNGTALTEVFDQHGDFNTNGTFTAPITGRYDLRCIMRFTNTTTPLTFTINLITSNRTYNFIYTRAAGLAADQSVIASAICDLDISDTATVTGVVTGEVGDTDGILGSSTLSTYFCGALIA